MQADHKTPAERTMMDREDVERLLPWYVAGTLDADDMARVDAVLATTSEFDAQIATIRDDRIEAITSNEEIRGPSSRALDRLMSDIASEPPQPRSLQAGRTGLISRIGTFLAALSPGSLGLAAATAALLICLQAGILTSNLLQSNTTFETASGSAETVSGTLVLIQFKPDTTIDKISTFLDTNHAVIISGPENGAFFKVRIGDETLTSEARATLMQRLKAQESIIEMVLPSG